MWKNWKELNKNEFTDPGEGALAALLVASCEQHANHLPMGTDVLLGTEILKHSAGRARRPVYLLPPLTYGFSAHHMDFPGSITLRQETLIHVIEEVISGVVHAGFRNVLLFVSHGGNTPAVHVALNELGIKYRDCLMSMIKYWDFLSGEIESIREDGMGSMGHAGEFETSLMMYLYPEYVGGNREGYKTAKGNEWNHPDMFAQNRAAVYRPFKEISEDGNVGVCTSASSQKGKRLYRLATEEIGRFMDGFYERKKV